MSIVFLVLKLWQNIVQGWGDTLQTAQSVNANQKKKKRKKNCIDYMIITTFKNERRYNHVINAVMVLPINQ